MKKILIFLGIAIISFITSCTTETYEPGKIPTESDEEDINNIFPKNIMGLARETFLTELNDGDCHFIKLTANYGDSTQISISVIKTYQENCAYLYFLKILKNKKEEDYHILSNRKDMFISVKDNRKEIYWTKENYCFSIQADKENFSQVARSFKYLIVKN